ncbi:hypothetical protein ABR737_34400 [Streptomyces sp. Edi2]|uniref:hypothetical protein n=1 Tax=Streptomyces sp. Edi2 TaxID=3162528 RepID=UPI003305CAB2
MNDTIPRLAEAGRSVWLHGRAGATAHTITAGDHTLGEQSDVLPDLGPRTRAEVPDDTRQALVVRRSDRSTWTSKAVL